MEIFYTNGFLRAELRAGLKPLNDLERLTQRVASGTAQPRDLVGMRATLQRLPALRNTLAEENQALLPLLKGFDLCSQELEILETAIADDPPATLQSIGVIKSGFSAELDGVIERSRHAREWIAGLEAVERKRTGIKTLKVGYNKRHARAYGQDEFSAGVGLAQLSSHLSSGGTQYPIAGDGVYLRLGAGIERFFYRSMAWDFSLKYMGILHDGQLNNDFQLQGGLIFYAAY